MRQRAIGAARGDAPFDVLLTGATLVDVATSELRAADVGIVGELIASVHAPGARADAKVVHKLDGYLAPGFIDTHVHFESSHLTPEHYAAVVVPQGTTTVVYDPHELANVLGVDGVRWAIEASRGLPLRFLCMAPSSVPSAPGLETSGAEFAGPEMREMLSWPEVVGVAEMMDMNGVVSQSERMREILEAGFASGKLICGHARGLTGAFLQAYATAGVASDHELTSGEDALEKLRAGFTLEIRGSHDYVLPGIVEVLNRLPQIPSTVTICTDDVPPDTLLEKGGMCDVIRRLVGYGLDPIQAIRCATLNAAQRLGRRDLGLIAPGRLADMIVLSDLHGFQITRVFTAKKHESLPASPLPNTTQLRPLSLDDCRVRVSRPDGTARLRVIQGARFTKWNEVEVQVRGGYAEVPPGYGVLLIQHRHGRYRAAPKHAVISDWGEFGGAIAYTYLHDSHNLTVLGRSPIDMQVAANAVIRAHGGMAVAAKGQVTALCEFPIAGMLSAESPEKVANAYAHVRAAADAVMEWQPPYRTFKALGGLSLACNPGPHLTDLGLTDGSTGEIVSLLID